MVNQERLSDLIRIRISNVSDGLMAFARVLLEVGDVMQKEVITIASDETAFSASKMMSEKNVSCIVVMDSGCVVGILTETDFLRMVASNDKDFDKIRLTEIMSSPVESIPSDLSVFEASKIMQAKRIKRLPILHKEQLVGIVTQTDLVQALASYYVCAKEELLTLKKTKKELHESKERLSMQNSRLQEIVRQQTADIIETRDVTVFALAKLAESRDTETGKHLERMRLYCQILAEQLAKELPYADELDEQFLENLYRSSPLHDIGKVGIPDTILLKPGRLNASEFAVMKQHALIGFEALKTAAEHSNCGSFLVMSAEIAASHHERFDGSGYPAGLKGQDIPLAARIVAVADVYDAITSTRVYRSALEPQVAKNMIEQEEGRHFDPAIVDAFRVSWDDFLKVPALIDKQKPELMHSAVSEHAQR